MYYEEKLIDGRLCFRNRSDGEWHPFTDVELSRRLMVAMELLREYQDRHDFLTENN